MFNILDTKLLSADDVLLRPQYGKVRSRSDVSLQPFIYSAPMDRVTGVQMVDAMISAVETPVVCRDLTDEDYIYCLFSNQAFFAVGSTKSEIERFERRAKQYFYERGGDRTSKINIAIDVAHGDSVGAYEAIAAYKKFPYVGDIMSGSIATGEAAIRCVNMGCTHNV